jgi:F420-dependent oxidoreductase-like protein
MDALTALAVAGREVPGIELGTAVVPTYPRHPAMLAAQALTTQAIIGGRLALGIGLSHQVVIESMFGLSFDKPARHMREYLEILVPLVHSGSVSFAGETLTGHVGLDVKGATPFPILVAALGTKMLELAGTVADGTLTWMTGPATIESHIVPTITVAAERAGRPAPRVGVGLPVCVTDDEAAARERAASLFEIYGTLPSYRAMLDREGAGGPSDVALVGDEAAVSAEIERLGAIGATDLVANVFGSSGERDRTRALLRSLV